MNFVLEKAFELLRYYPKYSGLENGFLFLEGVFSFDQCQRNLRKLSACSRNSIIDCFCDSNIVDVIL